MNFNIPLEMLTIKELKKYNEVNQLGLSNKVHTSTRKVL